jgi:ABC-type transport system involved in cytochrome c biogenesis ATPase subunit
MLQRAAMARVQAMQADVWLLDEPATGLDTEGRQILERVVLGARDEGVAVVVATHLSSLVAVADQNVDLRAGALVNLREAS